MDIRTWFRPPRQVLTIFLAMGLVSAGALGGLTWQILGYQRDLEAKHQADQLQQTADRAAAAMQRALADLRLWLGSSPPAPTSTDESLPADVLAVTLSASDLTIQPPARLLYYPAPAASGRAPEIFREGERLESAAHTLAGAARVYARLTRSADPTVRAGALMRLARVEHRLGVDDRALAAYDDLFALSDASAGGWPAPLVARLGRMAIFRAAGRASDLANEAGSLLADLQYGHWHVTKPAYEAFTAEARAVLPDAAPADTSAVSRAEAVLWLSKSREALNGEGQRVLTLPTGPALVLWAARSSTVEAVVAGPAYLRTVCATALPVSEGWVLSDPGGNLMLGQPPPPGTVVFVPAVGVDLPWRLQVYGPPGAALPPSPQRRLLLLVLGLVVVVLAGGWYAIFRSLAREQRVARLQSDFIAAVSHEFRSPLTSLAHVADLLEHNRLASDALRRESYGILVRDTARLRTLVEGLLDFGRFETGASAFRFETLDVGELIATTVADFQRQIAADGREVRLDGGLDGLSLWGDREALGRALWNLLDNAVKYSPGCRTVWVEVGHTPEQMSIAVRDQGLGIPAAEQTAIFDRFVRGTDSKRRRIRGTGIGLAMVSQIVQAHGGRVTVESGVGTGSTFTIVVPITRRDPERSKGNTTANATDTPPALKELWPRS